MSETVTSLEEVFEELQNVFPKELTIAVRNVQIRKLQEENEKLKNE